MENRQSKGDEMWWKTVVAVLFPPFLLVLLFEVVRCRAELRKSHERLAAYKAKKVELSYGTMTYIDRGSGVPILSCHGIFGGYDQAFDNVSNYASRHRILAPSRFGYLGSGVRGEGTPKEQVKAYVELLDMLGIDKVFVMGASAGGTIAIRFALEHPERTHGLILYSSAMPFPAKPASYPKYQGPPAFVCRDYPMYFMRSLFGPLMGMEPAIVKKMMPISERRTGVVLDATITNPDMARNFEDYPVEDLRVPSIVLQAEDDKLANFGAAEKAVPRFPRCTFVAFKTGGHMMIGHEQEVDSAVNQFMDVP